MVFGKRFLYLINCKTNYGNFHKFVVALVVLVKLRFQEVN